MKAFHIVSKHGPLHHSHFGYELNGQTDLMQLPSHWGGTPELTLEAWIRPTRATGDFQAILSSEDLTFVHFQTYRKGAGNANIAIYTDKGVILMPVIPEAPLNQWRHVALSVKSGDTRLYIDGVQHGHAHKKTFNYIKPTDKLYIGSGHRKGRRFKGQIADLSIWNHARTHDQIHDDIYQFLDKKPPKHDDKNVTVGLKSAHNKYLSAQPDGRLECNRDWLRQWEYITIQKLDDGKVALKTYHNTYISARADGTMNCISRVTNNVKWTKEEKNGRVGFKSVHGKYMSAQPDGRMECNRDWLLGWELFGQEEVQ